MKRPETGSMVFNGDWPGVFIRGDNCAAYALAVEALLGYDGDAISRRLCYNLIDLLRSAHNEDPPSLQAMKWFPDCLMEGSNEV